MLEIERRTDRLCEGLTRRSLLKVGSLGLAGLALPDILRIRQAQAATARKDTAVILLWMAGGPSHIDTYDPKPDAPSEIRGPFRPISTNVSGLQLCELLPGHARVADKLAFLRSLHHEHKVHHDASHWVQTGYPMFNAVQRGQQYPAQGSVVSAVRGPNAPGMPAYACIPEAYPPPIFPFFQRAAYLGAHHDPFNTGLDPKLGNFRAPEFALPPRMTLQRFQNRRELLRAVDGVRGAAEQSGQLEAMDQVQQRAFELVTGTQVRDALDLSREPLRRREHYGPHAWGQAALLARRLVEAGVTFVTINLHERQVDNWDDHADIERKLRRRLPLFDHAFCALIEDLHTRGLSDRVLVVAGGEFGRAPQIDHLAGRAHWPGAFSTVLSGGGIRGGQVVGATTADGGEPSERPLSPGDLLATIYRVLGIDPLMTLPDRERRPVPLVPEGEPIHELF